MANSFDKLKELNLSRDEVDRIGEALRKPEFRKLLTDYVEELKDPKNRKLYQEELALLEKERGVDVTFIDPKPGYVIKTSVNGSQKAFVNVCVSEHVNKPSSSPTIKEGTKGISWSLPHTMSHPREDVDNKGVRCQVYDVVYHPDTLHLAEKNRTFRNMVNETSLEAIESNFDAKLDKKNLKFPKISYKGMPHLSVIRKPSDTKPDHTPEEQELYKKIFAQAEAQNSSPVRRPKRSRRNSLDDKSNYTTPKYVIKHRRDVDIQEFTENKDSKLNVAIPKDLVIEVNLPLLKSSTDITLDVTEKTLQLITNKPAKYKLNLTLPYSVNESTGNAKFDKDLKTLIVTLPVRRSFYTSGGVPSDFDSGVESDQCCPGSPPESDRNSDGQHLLEEIQSSESDKPSEKCDKSFPQFRTKFLNENHHYSLPEFACHVFENTIAFTFNVKNVDENSVTKLLNNAGTSVHVKFTSISSSFYPSHYAFYIHLPLHEIIIEEINIEIWDNNVILQIPVNHDKPVTSYLYGVDLDQLTEKYVEDPEVINQVLRDCQTQLKIKSENIEPANQSVKFPNFPSPSSSLEENPVHANKQHIKLHYSEAVDIAGTSYESSGDELSCSSFSPRKSKGILKRYSDKRMLVGRSISESSLDEFVSLVSENCHASLDSVIPELVPEDGEVSTSLKKTVRFNDNVMRQLFRSNSSILGQKKKNQRKAQKKKLALVRRHSESEVSEADEKKEGDFKDWRKENSENEELDKEDEDIFQIDVEDTSTANHVK